MPLDERALRRFDEVLSRPGSPRRLADRGRALFRAAVDLGTAHAINMRSPASFAAAMSLQLPLMQKTETRRADALNLSRRGFRASEMLLTELADFLPAEVMDETLRTLLEIGSKSPSEDCTKALADAANLADFGVVALLSSSESGDVQRRTSDVAQAFRLRVEYGYWQSRLRDDFHFDTSRTRAAEALRRGEQIVRWYEEELPPAEASLS